MESRHSESHNGPKMVAMHSAQTNLRSYDHPTILRRIPSLRFLLLSAWFQKINPFPCSFATATLRRVRPEKRLLLPLPMSKNVPQKRHCPSASFSINSRDIRMIG